jgi:putative (di)nucleoside polyphosphate hydrolase
MDDFSHLPYRPCVGVMLVNPQGLVFVGKRIDTKEGDRWQMPQGGLDEGEDWNEAAVRELHEETGIRAEALSFVARTRDELFYELPDELKGKIWGGCYRGQRQHWFLARFTGRDSDIRLDAHQPTEFCDWRWVQPETLPEIIVPFKRRVYEAVLDEFRNLI